MEASTATGLGVGMIFAVLIVRYIEVVSNSFFDATGKSCARVTIKYVCIYIYIYIYSS